MTLRLSLPVNLCFTLAIENLTGAGGYRRANLLVHLAKFASRFCRPTLVACL